MATRRRRLEARRVYGDDDHMMCCHRAGYAHITAQACLERHTARPAPCGGCGYHQTSLAHMAEATAVGGVHKVLQVVRDQKISTISDPVVRDADRQQEGRPGDQKVNTFIVWINGQRAPSGAAHVETKGNLNQMIVDLVVSREVLKGKALNVVAVDQFLQGRLQARYEWARTAMYKDSDDAVSVRVRLTAVASDAT